MAAGKKANKHRTTTVHIKDSEFRSAVSAARTAYMVKNNGEAPSIEEVNAVCDVPMHRLGRILASDEFNIMMSASGIPWKRVKGLTSEQNYMLLILTNPNEKRSFDQCLRDAGVTWVTYKAWMRQPLFGGIVRQLSQQGLQDWETVANNSLMKKVESGDVRALEFYYRMTGIYDPNATQERDFQGIMAGVIDIIQRNVNDPVALKNIADGIKHLMSGGSSGPAIEASYRQEKDADVVDVSEISGVGVPLDSPEPDDDIPNIIPPLEVKTPVATPVFNVPGKLNI